MRIVRQDMTKRGTNTLKNISIAQMDSSHFQGVVDLQRACFPEPFPQHLLWTPDHLASHHHRFPEGQFVALDGEQVIGSASSLVLSETTWSSLSTWEGTCGGWYFENHDNEANTLFGADIGVHPQWRGHGVAKRLYDERFTLVRQLGLTRFGTACRIPGFSEWSTNTCSDSILTYCRLVADGNLADPTLTPLLKMGLTLVRVAYNFMDDPESADAAAVLELRN